METLFHNWQYCEAFVFANADCWFSHEAAHFRTERSGEVTLRTTQFLEQLRKNPTLKMMRDELVSLIQEELEKIGISPVSYAWIFVHFTLYMFVGK